MRWMMILNHLCNLLWTFTCVWPDPLWPWLWTLFVIPSIIFSPFEDDFSVEVSASRQIVSCSQWELNTIKTNLINQVLQFTLRKLWTKMNHPNGTLLFTWFMWEEYPRWLLTLTTNTIIVSSTSWTTQNLTMLLHCSKLQRWLMRMRNG